MNVQKDKKLLLTQIRLDGTTQTRDLNLDVVAEYKEHIKGGGTLPPIEVMCDGKAHWMVDGFHRWHAHREAGTKFIHANITPGTQRDAIWMSFAANTGHGLRREKGVLEHILRRIYDDADWVKVSQSEIAKHVKCTHQNVNYWFAKFTEEQSASCKHLQDRQDEDYPETTQKTGRMSKIEVKRGNQTFEMTTPAKKTAAKEGEFFDTPGNKVPKDLVDVFSRIEEISDFTDSLNEMHKYITKKMTAGDHVWRCFDYNTFEVELQNLKEVFKFAKPYAVCPYCGGRVGNMECRACEGSGWVNEKIYRAIPEELKKVKKGK